MKNTWKGIKNILNFNNKGTPSNPTTFGGEEYKGVSDDFNHFFTGVDNDIPNSINLRDANIYHSSRIPHPLLLAPSG